MRLIFLVAIVLNCLSTLAVADVKLGVSNAQQGPSSQLGLSLNLGAEIYFSSVNQQGGTNGQQIQLIKMDDGYEPINTVANTKSLLKQNVLALFNFVGTPTSKAIMPLVNRWDSLYITPFTGADFLRQPSANNVFNLRASYQQEAYAQVEYLLQHQKIKSFGTVIQADAFGLAVEKYYRTALKKHGLDETLVVRFRRNTLDIEKAAQQLKENSIEAVLFVGTYAPLTSLISLGDDADYKPIYSSVSFVSSQTLFSELKAVNSDHNRVLVSEVVPNPKNCTFTVCEQFREAAKQHQLSTLNHVHFEGFLNAKWLSEALNNCPAPITKTCLKHQLQTHTLTFLGKPHQLNPNNRQMMNEVYFSRLNLP
jgi:branched-chain amino acid transport system substrate-binding protein